jgi:anti-sigma regulatory factor (Ser/Thr protein kinase)
MEVNTTLRVPVAERSQVSAARIEARDLARAAGFSEEDEYRAGLVVTELATNLVKHAAEGGEILLRTMAAPVRGIEILAIDSGPGVPDITRALQDGVSSGDSAGTGLGAIRRLSDVFDIHSSPAGTAILACVTAHGEPDPWSRITTGGVSVPIQGEPVSGDLWSATLIADEMTVIVVDGLGHGAGAHEAARAVLDAANPAVGPQQALERMHQAVRHTRGAAAAVARLSPGTHSVVFAGIGNISGVVVTDTSQHQMVSSNGTLGHQAQGVREYVYPWPAGAVVVFFSDGLASHWKLDRYPGLSQRHPALIAAVLYRDHRRRRDDVTVVVARASV